MATYKIVHEETLVSEYFVDASTEKEALERFSFLTDNGEVDYSSMELVSSSDVPYLVAQSPDSERDQIIF